jgi:hypothetical protein
MQLRSILGRRIKSSKQDYCCSYNHGEAIGCAERKKEASKQTNIDTCIHIKHKQRQSNHESQKANMGIAIFKLNNSTGFQKLNILIAIFKLNNTTGFQQPSMLIVRK